MDKVGKNFKLTIQMDFEDEAIEITPPLSVQFEVVRNTGAQANTGTFRIYNLKQSTRNKIFQDLFDLSSRRKVVFQAGYGDNTPIIFLGDLRKAYSRREGVDIITELHCFDDGQGDMMNAFSNRAIAAGSSIKDVISGLMGDMVNSQRGEIGDFDNKPQQRGASLIGNTWTILNKYTGGNVYIDLGQINVLKPNEVIEGIIPRIDSQSGLLGTPQRQDAKLTADCIFEPNIRVGQVIEIESEVQKEFNGQFKVIGISHSGIMGEGVAGEVKTTMELLIPNVINNQSLNLVQGGKITPLLYGKINNNLRGIYGYLLKFNTPPALNITKNISWKEALMDYSAQKEAPNIQILANLERTAEYVQGFVDTYFPGKHIQINSGWRSKRHNATISGASPTSHHIYGLALDFQVLGVPIAAQNAAARKYMIGEVITYSWGQHYGLQSKREVRNGDR